MGFTNALADLPLLLLFLILLVPFFITQVNVLARIRNKHPLNRILPLHLLISFLLLALLLYFLFKTPHIPPS